MCLIFLYKDQKCEKTFGWKVFFTTNGVDIRTPCQGNQNLSPTEWNTDEKTSSRFLRQGNLTNQDDYYPTGFHIFLHYNAARRFRFSLRKFHYDNLTYIIHRVDFKDVTAYGPTYDTLDGLTLNGRGHQLVECVVARQFKVVPRKRKGIK
ncbi:MAG: hypothetical protein ACXABY_04325 [Candidatus Thorarchaeota archaeon]|jgi:hypothetical protein